MIFLVSNVKNFIKIYQFQIEVFRELWQFLKNLLPNSNQYPTLKIVMSYKKIPPNHFESSS